MTAQIHELLTIDGRNTSMAFCPTFPLDHPRIVERDPAEPLQQEDGIMYSTACWRGYQGTWEIKDGKFYLTSLHGRFRLLGEEPLLADWFSGMLRIPVGELLHYVHMGFGSVYEEEAHIRISEGLVVETRRIDNRGKAFDRYDLGWKNLPGGENRFPGDEDF